MKATKKNAGPMLIEAKTASAESPPVEKVPSNPGKSQLKTGAACGVAGDPDHSLVPAPSKRLLEPADFFRYWMSIPKRERQAWFIAYVYRKFPICDVLQPLREDELRAIRLKQKKAPETNCGKIAEPLDPEKWEREVYEKWGAGDYYIRLNDTHPSVRGTVTETQIRGLRDWDKFPPILNVEEVVIEEALNQPYLRWARLHNINFPGDPGYNQTATTEQENDEMAANASVEKLTDALIEMTARPQPVHQAPVVAPPDRSNEILADAALKGQQILLDSIKAQGKAQDPMEFHRAVTEAAKAMVPAPVVATSSGPSITELLGLLTAMNAPLLASNQAMLEAERARTASAEKRLELLEARLFQQQQPAAPPAIAPEVSNPVRNAIDLLKGLVSLRDQAGSLLGGEGASEPDMPLWGRLVSKAIDAAPGMLYNAAVMRSGNGQPVAPGELNPAVIEAEQQLPAAPEPVQEDDSVISDKRIAQEIAAPLIAALNDGRKGFEFAAGMILTPKLLGFPGRVVYEMAVDQGQDGMYRILQSSPELWAQLARIPNQFQAFLNEFLDRAQAYAVVEAQRAPQAAPAAVSPKVEVMPPVEGRPNGRAIVNPASGKPVHTAPVVDSTVA